MLKIGEVIRQQPNSHFKILDEQCTKEHARVNYPEYKMGPCNLMLIDGKRVCPRCELEKFNEALSKQISSDYEKNQSRILFNKSIVPDETIWNARFDNYEATEKEEIENLQLAKEYAEKYAEGISFNVVGFGNPGAGKSHLGFSILYYLNSLSDKHRSCLFLNFEDMVSKIRDSFRDPESKYTPSYFTNLISQVDFLVLDDLGAETGAIDSAKQATDFVQRVLYATTNSRQGKSTIITTNLKSDTLKKMYDAKLISRLFARPKFLLFKETSDKRMNDLPF